MVAPLAGDPEVASREADPLEAVLLQNPLGRNVVHERSRLEAVQAELAERNVSGFADRPRCQAAATEPLSDPEAEIRALKRTTHDVRQRHRPRDAIPVEDRERPNAIVLDPLPLAVNGEKVLLTIRLEGREERAVLDHKRNQLGCVLRLDRSDRHAAGLPGVPPAQRESPRIGGLLKTDCEGKAQESLPLGPHARSPRPYGRRFFDETHLPKAAAALPPYWATNAARLAARSALQALAAFISRASCWAFSARASAETHLPNAFLSFLFIP